MAEAKVRNIIEASTTEINDSINFNRRVYSTRGHQGTQWIPEKKGQGKKDPSPPKEGKDGRMVQKITKAIGHVCTIGEYCCAKKPGQSDQPAYHKSKSKSMNRNT